MNYRMSTVERAYELAKSGACATVEEIKQRLKAEGYESVHSHLAAPGLGRELRALCKASASR